MTVTVSSAPAGTITVQPGDRTPASIVIKNFNIENATTSEIQEGVNLYFSNARAVAALTAGQTQLLLPLNATPFTDSSTNAITITNIGAVTSSELNPF